MMDFREDAEGHWYYTVGLIERVRKLMLVGGGDEETIEEWLELLKYLYVEAMVHGYGHGWEARENEG
tara:strand:- start:84 stop:284 length:201 start_codon:yes stop_codon:yes gene_type:complete